MTFEERLSTIIDQYDDKAEAMLIAIQVIEEYYEKKNLCCAD